MALWTACRWACFTIDGGEQVGPVLLYQSYGYWSFSCCSHSFFFKQGQEKTICQMGYARSCSHMHFYGPLFDQFPLILFLCIGQKS